MVSWDRTLIGRAGYYIRMEVNPQNDDEVFVLNSSFHRSIDGGADVPRARAAAAATATTSGSIRETRIAS